MSCPTVWLTFVVPCALAIVGGSWFFQHDLDSTRDQIAGGQCWSVIAIRGDILCTVFHVVDLKHQ